MDETKMEEVIYTTGDQEVKIYSASGPTSIDTKTLASGSDSPDSMDMVYGNNLGFVVRHFVYPTGDGKTKGIIPLEVDAPCSIKRQLGGLRAQAKDSFKPPVNLETKDDSNYERFPHPIGSPGEAISPYQESISSDSQRNTECATVENESGDNECPFYIVTHESPQLDDLYKVEPGSLSPESISIGPPLLPICLARGETYHDAGET